MGRRKIEIQMVKDTNARQVTFSKRRTGLFKKANELSILCGAEVAIVVFSPGNKPFSFGHPDVDGVANRFLHLEPNENGAYGTSSSEIDKLDNLNQQLEHVMGEMLMEDKNGKEHEKALKKYKAPIEGFNSVHHQELNGSLAELKSVVELRVNEMEATAALLLLAEKYVDGKENHVAKNN